MGDEEDPYALSSDSEDDGPKKPIKIEGRSGDIKQLKSALLNENKDKVKDESRTEELAALKENKEIRKMKQDFEEGKVNNVDNEEDDAIKIARLEERQKLTEIGKEKYSKFKTKFENLDSTLEENLEERLKRMQKDTVELSKEAIASAKERFEKNVSDTVGEREKVDIERSADLQKMKAAFSGELNIEPPKDCHLCGKIVYPVERVVANKKLYHINCFKCSKCNKKLSPTNYNTHESKLLCKVHMLEVFHPEQAKGLDPSATEAGGTAVHDELAQLKSLREKRGDFESSIKESQLSPDKRTQVDTDLMQAGKVKANAEKFVSGAALEHNDEDNEGSGRVKKEELNFENVGDLKEKWKKGDVETAPSHEATERKELEALKGGISVKERFKERKEGSDVVERQWNRDELDTSAASEARRSFMEGHVYEGNTNIDRTAKDLDDLKFTGLKDFKEKFEKGGDEESEVQKTTVDVGEVQLGNIKATFEKPEQDLSAEERAELKKREIEAEFLRYKLARRAAVERNQADEELKVEAGENADVGSIKDRFDRGEAFKGQVGDEKQLDVELKMAGKAREKFRQIDAQGAAPVAPNLKKPESSKWDKKDDRPAAEVINKRVQEDDVVEGDDAFDVKNLMNKFKNISDSSNQIKPSSEHRAELDALKMEAKSFKAKFEQPDDNDDAIAEQRRRQREEEFELLKREREEAQRQLDDERREEEQSQRSEQRDEDVAIKVDHASKMAAKWEKIQAKEAKKAEKGRMPEKKSLVRFELPPPDKCAVCTKSVYRAEQFQCFGSLYHTNCFRCAECRQALRVERVHRSKKGQLFCKVHYKLYEERQLATEENNNVRA